MKISSLPGLRLARGEIRRLNYEIVRLTRMQLQQAQQLQQGAQTNTRSFQRRLGIALRATRCIQLHQSPAMLQHKFCQFLEQRMSPTSKSVSSLRIVHEPPAVTAPRSRP